MAASNGSTPTKCLPLARILRWVKTEDRCYVIAVVDDDPTVLESLGNLFESVGYRVRLFEAAEAILEGEVVSEIDALISDIRMPGLDGIELQRRVGLRRPELPVILITAREDVVTPRLLQANNRGVFRKPINAVELMNAVAKALA